MSYTSVNLGSRKYHCTGEACFIAGIDRNTFPNRIKGGLDADVKQIYWHDWAPSYRGSVGMSGNVSKSDRTRKMMPSDNLLLLS